MSENESEDIFGTNWKLTADGPWSSMTLFVPKSYDGNVRIEIQDSGKEMSLKVPYTAVAQLFNRFTQTEDGKTDRDRIIELMKVALPVLAQNGATI